ncbi:TlyA family RNA methyltransferase [Pseudactinotalea sp. Z1748]|uniref:TlyA family RNA methyltransferase n=1 Tax=Pseudactinotalea sp. Z1748 TaxID=3413027 RepID=UPI003C7A6EFC
MSRRVRLDAELVRRGLARSRQHAAELIGAGRVLLDGQRATKAATQLLPAQPVRLLPADQDAAPEYVSRGGHKLAGALDALGERAPRVRGRRVLDAGASTGGFTDVLLRRGAAHVVAVDVGYGQLDWKLRTDERVTVLDRTNVRSLVPDQVQPPPELITADLSFISLTLVLPALLALSADRADLLLMVKPQFEVGRERLGSGGVVREESLRAWAVAEVARCATGLGAGVLAVVPSPLPGPSGNVEYFLHLRHGAARGPVALAGEELAEAINTAIRTGPAGAVS